MSIKWGSTYVTAVKWGNTNCTQVKWGSTVVFPNGGYDGSSFSPPFTNGLRIYSNDKFLNIDKDATKSDMQRGSNSIRLYSDDKGGFILSLRTTYTINMSLYNKFKINYVMGSHSDMVTSEGEEFIMREFRIGFNLTEVGGTDDSRYIKYEFLYGVSNESISGIEQDISNLTGNLYFAFILFFYKGSKSGTVYYTFNFNSIEMY